MRESVLAENDLEVLGVDKEVGVDDAAVAGRTVVEEDSGLGSVLGFGLSRMLAWLCEESWFLEKGGGPDGGGAEKMGERAE